ncbi:hypothetical protein BKA56DRAFT_664551 [Ilyonectria sp. MPI-CAGE-AT-0026]|nr:hypothetical protein BKA56DRAFT_664551 [Ilyonectria sp. MPI-CAGE-AT-0026]
MIRQVELHEAARAALSILNFLPTTFTMDSAMGQFRGVDRLNATTIVPSRDVVARKQSLIVAAAMGGFIFAVIITVVVFMVLTYRAHRPRRNMEIVTRLPARTTASDTNANV